MKKINIQEIIQKNSLDARKVAEALFPHNKWPDSALARVIQKQTRLDEQQLFSLAALAGTSVDALYS